MTKNILIKALAFFLLTLLVTGCNLSEKSEEQKPAKYVFLFIGDGMGLAHKSLTEAYLADIEGEIGIHSLLMDEFPVHGICNTWCENRQITGSAAAGTALATGNKTSVGAISKNSDYNTNFTSIAMDAKNAGMRVGIITTVSIDHATPAVFYAHADLRNQYYDIGRQLSESGFDYFAGGGFIFPEGRDNSKENLYEYTKDNNYQVFREKQDLKSLECSLPLLLVNPVLLDDAEMPYAIDPEYQQGYSLSEILEHAIKCLESEDGFFMMIESGKIDWAAHQNDAASIVQEIVELDNAIQIAYDFYLKHPDETLIVITADHETGGLSLGNAGLKYDSDFKLLAKQKYSLQHIESDIYEYVQSSMSLTDVVAYMDTAFCDGNMNFDEDELLEIENAYWYVQKGQSVGSEADTYLLYGDYYPLASVFGNIINKRAGVGFTTWSHTAIPVPIMAIGTGSQAFDSYLDNTDIPLLLKKAMWIDRD